MATRKAAAPHTRPESMAPTTAATGDLAEYEVDGPGGAYTVLLNAADAKAWGAKAVTTPQNRAVSPQNK